MDGDKLDRNLFTSINFLPVIHLRCFALDERQRALWPKEAAGNLELLPRRVQHCRDPEDLAGVPDRPHSEGLPPHCLRLQLSGG